MGIDRISPSKCPNRKPAGFQEWRSLLFMHWEVPQDKLRSLVPAPLELDLFNQTAFVGIVPFEMKAIRPRNWPRKWGFNFLELNVRTYVLFNNRPGVYFFSLDASSRIAVWAARKGWSLPYHFARMKTEQSGNSIHYQSQRVSCGSTHQTRYTIGDSLGPSMPDSLEHFLLERYLLFVVRRNRVLTGQVHHQPYPVMDAKVESISDSLMESLGLPAVSEPAAFAHYSPGVDVSVYSLADAP